MRTSNPQAAAKAHALQIFRAALNAADPQLAVERHLKFDGRVLIAGKQRYKIADFDRIFVVGAGKASAAMAAAVERILGRSVSGGLINVPDGVTTKLKRVKLNPARHPLPDDRGVEGARQIAALASDAGERDLVICLISGGASALLPMPASPLTLARKQELTRALLNAGATIHELNTVRKHLSGIKGGQLAALAYPARVLGLLLSDVIGDDLDVIGSGPTVGDPATVADAQAVLRKYGLATSGLVFHETPKPTDPRLSRTQNMVIGSNRLAIDAAADKARQLGYHVLVLSTMIDGETRDIAAMHSAIAKEIASNNRPARRPACILSGGETTVAVRGTGLGGRNQEFVLAAAIALQGASHTTVLSAGTDGLDGPTDAAGAIADGTTVARGAARGLDAKQFLANNDSYHFLEPLGALLKTGPTGTNVMDIRVLLIQDAGQ
ncbi:MAG: glycerate kinase [Acidobacteriota bacterium]